MSAYCKQRRCKGRSKEKGSQDCQKTKAMRKSEFPRSAPVYLQTKPYAFNPSTRLVLELDFYNLKSSYMGTNQSMGGQLLSLCCSSNLDLSHTLLFPPRKEASVGIKSSSLLRALGLCGRDDLGQDHCGGKGLTFFLPPCYSPNFDCLTFLHLTATCCL